MRRSVLGVALLAVTFATGGALVAHGDGPDDVGGGDVLLGNDGHSVSVIGSKTTQGAKPKKEGKIGSNRSPARRAPALDIDLPRTPTPFESCLVDWDSYRGCWRNSIPSDPTKPKPPEGEAAPELPPITIADLATFSPATGTVVGEPDNLGVAGLPTNFITEAQQHVRSGELFGFPIDVRFTPVSYTFRYGDGETATSSSPGATWESLGQAQFTPTPTSHTYAERGTYDAQVDIAYTAEIDLGVGWFPIDGQLDIPGPTQQIRIYEAHTALVARTCAEQPSAPGC